MAYNVLIAGNNASTIDDFFLRLHDDFELLTTSIRFDDVDRHLKYFTPDIFVYCINDNYFEDGAKLISVKNLLAKNDIPFVLIGSKDACVQFERGAINVSDLTLVKPITIYAIQEQITKFLEERLEPEEPAADSPVSAPEPVEAVLEPQIMAEVNKMVKPKNERKHILVVDDNSLMLKVIKEHLRNEYDVATALNGKVALRFLEKKKTDLILLDYEMPGEDGPTILGKLREIDSVKDVPVIFLTGISEKDKIRKALSMKPQGYLLKPIEREALLEAIHKYLG
ncbi:MAG: response regulator [Clostridium sp.]|nr:response regulator [Clostridium sp.]